MVLFTFHMDTLQRLETVSRPILHVHYLDQSVGLLQFLPRCMQCRRGIAMRILSVRLSLCPSVCHTRVLWQNGRKICPDLYTIRKNI